MHARVGVHSGGRVDLGKDQPGNDLNTGLSVATVYPIDNSFNGLYALGGQGIGLTIPKSTCSLESKLYTMKRET